MGVVSGIVMSYQFGTNWAVFSDKTGPIISPLMAYEVLTVAALLTAVVVAGLSAIVVAIQMRSARGRRSSSQTAFAVEEEERSVSKPIVSAASLRAALLVFDATRTPDAAAGGAEREEPCSA